MWRLFIFSYVDTSIEAGNASVAVKTTRDCVLVTLLQPRLPGPLIVQCGSLQCQQHTAAGAGVFHEDYGNGKYHVRVHRAETLNGLGGRLTQDMSFTRITIGGILLYIFPFHIPQYVWGSELSQLDDGSWSRKSKLLGLAVPSASYVLRPIINGKGKPAQFFDQWADLYGGRPITTLVEAEKVRFPPAFKARLSTHTRSPPPLSPLPPLPFPFSLSKPFRLHKPQLCANKQQAAQRGPAPFSDFPSTGILFFHDLKSGTLYVGRPCLCTELLPSETCMSLRSPSLPLHYPAACAKASYRYSTLASPKFRWICFPLSAPCTGSRFKTSCVRRIHLLGPVMRLPSDLTRLESVTVKTNKKKEKESERRRGKEKSRGISDVSYPPIAPHGRPYIIEGNDPHDHSCQQFGLSNTVSRNTSSGQP